jgi:hypothetical protein
MIDAMFKYHFNWTESYIKTLTDDEYYKSYGELMWILEKNKNIDLDK